MMYVEGCLWEKWRNVYSWDFGWYRVWRCGLWWSVKWVGWLGMMGVDLFVSDGVCL